MYFLVVAHKQASHFRLSCGVSLVFFGRIFADVTPRPQVFVVIHRCKVKMIVSCVIIARTQFVAAISGGAG